MARRSSTVINGLSSIAILAALMLLTPESPAQDANASKAPVAARWQPPRILDHALATPLAMAVSGRRVALAAAQDVHPTLERISGDSIAIWISEDGGETWPEPLLLKGYTAGPPSLYFDANNCLTVVAQRAGSIDLLAIDANRKISKPRTIWADTELSRDRVCACTVTGGTWLFGCMETELAAVFVAADKAPQERVHFKNDAVKPFAWAADDQHCGVVTLEGRTLYHNTSSDGGVTWKRSAIPLALDGNSEFADLSGAFPLALTRDGKQLLLLVSASSKSGSVQNLLLGSSDLGATWGPPSAVGKRYLVRSPFEAWFIPDSMECAGGRLFVCANLTQQETGNHRTAISLLESPDQGKSWRTQPELAALLQPGFTADHAILSGDGKSVHVALRYKENDKFRLMVRSYTPGAWSAPAQPLPAWFKDELEPETTPRTTPKAGDF